MVMTVDDTAANSDGGVTGAASVVEMHQNFLLVRALHVCTSATAIKVDQACMNPSGGSMNVLLTTRASRYRSIDPECCMKEDTGGVY